MITRVQIYLQYGFRISSSLTSLGLNITKYHLDKIDYKLSL